MDEDILAMEAQPRTMKLYIRARMRVTSDKRPACESCKERQQMLRGLAKHVQASGDSGVFRAVSSPWQGCRHPSAAMQRRRCWIGYNSAFMKARLRWNRKSIPKKDVGKVVKLSLIMNKTLLYAVQVRFKIASVVNL